MDNSQSIWREVLDNDGSDDLYVGFVDNRNESENRSASLSEVQPEVQDENNNMSGAGAEEDHDGSDDEDDDEGTRTYWQVKAKEGHKVCVYMFVSLQN